MSEYIRCPKCGAMMTTLTSGYMCPVCGYRFPAQTVTQSCGTSAEYVEIVRCKDCKYAEHEDDGDILCTFWDFCECNHHVLENGYCDRAVRKDHE